MNKLSFGYVSSFINIHKYLNINNVEKLNKKQIDHIGKFCDAKFYQEYKTGLFWKWHQKTSNYTESYIRKFMRLKEKLGVEFDVTDYDFLNELWQKQFTSFRSFKTIEIPFETKELGLRPFAYFDYKNVRVYEMDDKDMWLKKQYQGELFISAKHLIFYNREEQKLIQIVKLEDIVKINYHNYSLEVVVKEGKPLHLRYYSNGIIYISLLRFWRKSDIIFTKEEGANLELATDQILELLFRIN